MNRKVKTVSLINDFLEKKKKKINKKNKKNDSLMPLGGDSWELWHILNLIK